MIYYKIINKISSLSSNSLGIIIILILSEKNQFLTFEIGFKIYK